MKSSKAHNLITKQQGQKAEVSKREQGAKQFPHLRGAYISLSQKTLKNYSVTHTKIIQPFPVSPRANLNFMKVFLISKSKEFKKLLLSPTLKNTPIPHTHTPTLQLPLKDWLSDKSCHLIYSTRLVHRGTEINTKYAYMSTDISQQGFYSLMVQQNMSTSWPYGHIFISVTGDFIPGRVNMILSDFQQVWHLYRRLCNDFSHTITVGTPGSRASVWISLYHSSHSNHKTVFHTEDRVTVPGQQDQEKKILE